MKTTITIAGMLRRISVGPQNTGICNQWTLNNLNPSARDLLKKAMARWPKYSGDLMYPIPAPSPDVTAYAAYHECESMWDKETAYGVMRWELLEWLIEQPELRKPLVVIKISDHCRLYGVEK